MFQTDVEDPGDLLYFEAFKVRACLLMGLDPDTPAEEMFPKVKYPTLIVTMGEKYCDR